MSDKAYERYKWTEDRIYTDAEYRYLMEKLPAAQADFQAAMDRLPPEHRQSVTEYLGLLAELQDRSVQIACIAP